MKTGIGGEVFLNQIENNGFVFRITKILFCELDDILNIVFKQKFPTINSATNYIPLILCGLYHL
jgi:hypothetical protein